MFLPGWGDIDQLKKRLLANFDTNRFKILPLHSQVSPEEQIGALFWLGEHDAQSSHHFVSIVVLGHECSKRIHTVTLVVLPFPE